MLEGIHITREQIDAMILAEASRLVAERVAAIPPAQLGAQLDWQPAEWFAQAWGNEIPTVRAVMKKLRVRIAPLSQKTKFYSVADVNQKLAERAIVPKPKRQTKIVQFQG